MATKFVHGISGQTETEKVAGFAWMKFLYSTWVGQRLLAGIFATTWWSRFMGWCATLPVSRSRIMPFVAAQEIDLNEFEEASYPHFNAFFVRKFKDGARTFSHDSKTFPAFAEARYFLKPIQDLSTPLVVKGQQLEIASLLGHPGWAHMFVNGTCIIARLCPKDYHRFHYPDDGTTLETRRMHGRLDSVHPFALAHKPEIFLKNERVVSVLETEHFGSIAYIEIGALGVGKIVQTHGLDSPFRRGGEKGYFLFGGSTVIVLTQAQRVEFDPRLIDRDLETWFPLGHALGRAH